MVRRKRDRAGQRRYEDVLRAIGHQLDEDHYISFALIETPYGFYVKGRALTDSRGEGGMQAISHNVPLTASDLDQMLEQARARRQESATRRFRWRW